MAPNQARRNARPIDKRKASLQSSTADWQGRLLSARDEATPQDYVRLALQLAVDRLKTRGLTVEQVMTVAREVLQPGRRRPQPLHRVMTPPTWSN